MITDPLKPDEDREDREDALPKWVRTKFELLRRRLSDERKANAALRGDVGETDTLIRDYSRPDRLLPRRAEITFLPDPARPDRAIECALRDGALRVYGSKGLVIKPCVSNEVTIELKD
jgi:hypothetical protein